MYVRSHSGGCRLDIQMKCGNILSILTMRLSGNYALGSESSFAVRTKDISGKQCQTSERA